MKTKLKEFELILRSHITKPKSVFMIILGPVCLYLVSFFLIFYFKRIEQAELHSMFLLTTVLTSIFFGFRSSVITSIICAITLDYFFVFPLGTIFDSINSYIRLIVYVFSSSLISFLTNLIKKELVHSKIINSDLELAIKQKDQLMALVAHDLRNPLGNIQSLIDIISEEESLSKDMKVELEMIKKSTSISLDIVSEVLNFSIIDNSNFQIKRDTIDINSLLLDVVESNRFTAKKKSIELIFNHEEKEVMTVGDKLLLYRSLQNLIDNAIKYSYLNSKIHISIQIIESEIKIDIKDEGPGISPEEQKNLFQPFYKTSNKPTGGELSTGLGLSGVERMIKLHKGKVTIISRKGEGSTFSIIIPHHPLLT